MANITSVTITRQANNIWTYQDNTMPSGKPMAASFNDGIINGDLVNFTTDNGGILYNGIPYNIITYVDSLDSGNNFTPTSAVGLIVALKGLGFFDGSSGGGSGTPTQFTDLTDTFANYFGRAGQFIIVNSGETGLTSEDFVIPQRFTDLLDTPNSLVANRILRVDPTGNAIILADPSIVNDPPILFKERKWISKGYRWLLVSGVMTRVANTQNILQVGGVVKGWVCDGDPDDPLADWYWMEAGRYNGNDPALLSSYQTSNYQLLAFSTDPDFI